MDANARRIALRMLAAEPILEDRRLLDEVAAPFTLTRSQDKTLVSAVLDKIQVALPDGIDQLVRRLADEEDAGLLDPDTGFGLTVFPLQAADGEIWVAAGGGRLVSGDDEQPGDEQLDEGSLEVINLLNLHSPGIYWDSVKGDFAALVGGAVPLRELNTSWLQVTIEMAVRAAGRADEILKNDSPYSRYLLAARMQDSTVPGFNEEAVDRAALQYVESLPAKLRRFTLSQRSGNTLELTFPFKNTNEVTPLPLHMVSVGVDQHTPFLPHPGFYVVSRFHTQLDEAEARRWVKEFNGNTASENEDWCQTTPWIMGGWVWVREEDNTCSIFYRGFLPHSYAGRLNLVRSVEGSLREVWSSWDKYRLWAAFSDTMKKGGVRGDLQAEN